MKRKILTILRQTDEYVSGQQICEALGVSRTAVWKTIRSLKSEGYEVEAVQNRGYRLMSAPDILTEAEVGSLRTDDWKDCPLAVYDVTDSTNTQARRMAEEERAPEGTLAVADVQSAGKGRRGRRWETPPGYNIAMSFVLRPKLEPAKASMLTILAALACCRAVRDLTGEEAWIKWPNDLVLNRRKVCGILTEMALEEDYIREVIVGIGFNVNGDSVPEDLRDKATSLYLETGRKYSRARLICLVMKHYSELYALFMKKESLADVREEYNRFLINVGKEVRILTPGENWNGVSLGINDGGELLVRDEEGRIQTVGAGEVSVRGLYGYA